MNNLENFLEYNIVSYIKNYCDNMLKREMPIPASSFRFVKDLTRHIMMKNAYEQETESLYFLRLGFLEIDNKYKKHLGLENESEYENEINYEDEFLEEIEKNSENIMSRRGERVNAIKPIYKKETKHLCQKITRELFLDYSKSASEYISKFELIIPVKIKEIFELFLLSDEEKALITIVYVAERSNHINSHVFQDDGQRHHLNSVFFRDSRTIQHQRIEYATNVPSSVVRLNFKDTSKLFLANLLENEEDPNLSEFLTDYIEGHSVGKFTDNIFEQVDLTEAFELKSNQLAEKDISNLEKILLSEKGISVLFKGLPGTGKTEMVKSLAKKLKIPLFNLKHSRKKKDKDIPPRKMALYLIQQLYENSKALFLVDECEDLINSKPMFKFFDKNSDDNLKSYINEYLDDSKCKMIFVANNTGQVDDSTMRRFNYIVTFNVVSVEHRELLLNNLFTKEDLTIFNPDEIKSLATNSKLNIGHYGLALKTVKHLDLAILEKKSLFLDIVNNHSKEFLGTGIQLKKINSNYMVDGLNADHDLKVVTEKLVKHHNKLIGGDSDVSLNIILSGPPGTGKTEYVKYLSQELKTGFIFKQASDLKSKYVGESEKNIKKAFMEAEESNSILFIDEIDAFLHPRDNASQSYQVSEVNEFLICLENFKGIFICATNSIKRMDPAALRRFLFKIKFDFLESIGALKFYNHFYNEYDASELSIQQLDDLKQIKNLTPSDFNTVKRKLIIEDEINHKQILNLLKQEVAHKKNYNKNVIGLGAN